jgi:hypothetical protein
MPNTQYRQGDVFIIRRDEDLPKGLKEVPRDKGRVVLAYGEVTGHAHAIEDRNVKLFRDPKLAEMFMMVTGDAPAALEHEEHSRIDLPPGNYQIIIQREYSPEAIRNVAD